MYPYVSPIGISDTFYVLSLLTNISKLSIAFIGPQTWKQVNQTVHYALPLKSFKYQYNTLLISQ